MRTRKSSFFESKIRLSKVTEDGTEAKFNELYVVDAMSFTETESKVTEYVSQIAQGEFEVLTETKAKYSEIFFSDDEKDDKFYKCGLSFIVLDEKSGKEKRSKIVYLVQGHDIESAKKNLDEVMKDSMMDYVTESVHETAVMDVIE